MKDGDNLTFIFGCMIDIRFLEARMGQHCNDFLGREKNICSHERKCNKMDQNCSFEELLTKDISVIILSDYRLHLIAHKW